MYPAAEEVQKLREYGLYQGTLMQHRAAPEPEEERQGGAGTRSEEDDLRIMQHFVSDFIDRSLDI